MAMLPDVFNAKDEDKMGDFTPLEPGWYIAEITKSEMKNTNAKTGKYLNLQLKVLDPEHAKGRYVYTLLNLINPSQTAVEIARKELATICEACGLDEIEDSTELHEIPMAIKLDIDDSNPNYPPKNVIKLYKPEDDDSVELAKPPEKD